MNTISELPSRPVDRSASVMVPTQSSTASSDWQSFSRWSSILLMSVCESSARRRAYLGLLSSVAELSLKLGGFVQVRLAHALFSRFGTLVGECGAYGAK